MFEKDSIVQSNNYQTIQPKVWLKQGVSRFIRELIYRPLNHPWVLKQTPKKYQDKKLTHNEIMTYISQFEFLIYIYI